MIDAGCKALGREPVRGVAGEGYAALLDRPEVDAAVVVARRRGPQPSGTARTTSVHGGEHMIGVEMSRHGDSGSTGGGVAL